MEVQMSDNSLDYRALFEDKATFGPVFWVHTITGVGLFCLVFFIGWLVFGYFWASLALGLIGLLTLLQRMRKMSRQQNANQKSARKAWEEAEQLGLDGEVSDSMVEEALRMLANSASNQCAR